MLQVCLTRFIVQRFIYRQCVHSYVSFSRKGEDKIDSIFDAHELSVDSPEQAVYLMPERETKSVQEQSSTQVYRSGVHETPGNPKNSCLRCSLVRFSGVKQSGHCDMAWDSDHKGSARDRLRWLGWDDC